MSEIMLVVNNRAERGPLDSVIAALPEARVFGLSATDQTWDAHEVMRCGLEQFTREYHRSRPRLVIVVGDRYETLAATLAAYLLRIPVAHIHGGERTAGAMDDAFRDSITRMSVLHFVATDAAGRRVAALQGTDGHAGVRPMDGIHLVGAPGLDGVPGNSALRDHKTILITYHPETRAPDYGVANCQRMLTAVSALLGYEVIFCGVNNDPGSAEINRTVRAHFQNHGGRMAFNMPHDEYVAMMQRAALVIGNSSAGVIEAPWVGLPTVLVGDRQLGREMSNSIFQDDFDVNRAIQRALSWRGPWEPCYKGGAAPRIAEVVREYVARE